LESPSLELSLRGEKTFEFRYVDYRIEEGISLASLPSPRGGEGLILRLADEPRKVELELLYGVYPEGVLTRAIRIIHHNEEPLVLHKASSYEISFPTRDFLLTAYVSAWGDEYQKEEFPLARMGYFFGSESGASGDSYAPFFTLRRQDSGWNHGDVYAFSLMYSGSHREEIAVNPYGYTRVQAGISPLGLSLEIPPNEAFESPWGVLTYSSEGINGIPEAFHPFVLGRILPSFHKDDLRPIVYNNWEGTYFDFTEAKLLSLARRAKRLGIECFVLDDGWFGHRDDDTSSLGDYSCDKKKLPRGLSHFGKKIHKMGMLFGLWVEPESVNEDSLLYSLHPDWAIQDGVHAPKKQRHQLLLDLTKKEVRDYVFSMLCATIEEASPDFIKWDFNRCMSDMKEGSGYVYRYYLSLYSLLRDLREKYPHLWMENCASGGSRNDYAMMSFFDHCWVSDNTDHYSRAFIQANMSLLFPHRCLSHHVAAKSSHKMLRKASLETKFDVASFGVLGFELDISRLEPIEAKEIRRQIEYYQEKKSLFQQGRFAVVSRKEDSLFLSVSTDKEAALLEVHGLQLGYPDHEYLICPNLEPGAIYHYEVRKEDIPYSRFGALVNQVSPISLKEEGYLLHAISRRFAFESETFSGEALGEVLSGPGILLPTEWSGGGIGENLAVLGDFGARLYHIRKIEEDASTKKP
ncbi:MAG: alpha-galactosidase, partial [Candidatus Enteromonas sp.]|nr:alpha-galactosidase [Candidatus Enteromonas sp.]